MLIKCNVRFFKQKVIMYIIAISLFCCEVLIHHPFTFYDEKSRIIFVIEIKNYFARNKNALHILSEMRKQTQ